MPIATGANWWRVYTAQKHLDLPYRAVESHGRRDPAPTMWKRGELSISIPVPRAFHFPQPDYIVGASAKQDGELDASLPNSASRHRQSSEGRAGRCAAGVCHRAASADGL